MPVATKKESTVEVDRSQSAVALAEDVANYNFKGLLQDLAVKLWPKRPLSGETSHVETFNRGVQDLMEHHDTCIVHTWLVTRCCRASSSVGCCNCHSHMSSYTHALTSLVPWQVLTYSKEPPVGPAHKPMFQATVTLHLAAGGHSKSFTGCAQPGSTKAQQVATDH